MISIDNWNRIDDYSLTLRAGLVLKCAVWVAELDGFALTKPTIWRFLPDPTTQTGLLCKRLSVPHTYRFMDMRTGWTCSMRKDVEGYVWIERNHT